MSWAQLIFNQGNYLDTIELDAIITEGSNATARVTENPVESGASANDHIIVDPMTFSMTAVVTALFGVRLGLFKAQAAWADLLEKMVEREPFTLVQHLKSYDHVVLLSLTQDVDKDTSNGLFFSATMKEIIYVGSEIVTADMFNNSDIADKMTPSIKGGLKQLTVF